MQWTGHPYLLCEELTDAARHALPAARNRGLNVIYDYRGVMPLAREENHALHSLVERLLAAWIAAAPSGSRVDCDVDVKADGPAHCSVRIEIDNADVKADPQREAREPAADSLLAARTLCQALNARFDYRYSRERGAHAVVDVRVPCLAPVDVPIETSAEGAEAWLLGKHLRGLQVRLPRLGWQVSTLPDVDAAERRLAEQAPPQLIVGNEWDGISLSDMVWLGESLKDKEPLPQLFLAVDGASEAARSSRIHSVNVQVLPFSPRQLLHVTHLARLARRASA